MDVINFAHTALFHIRAEGRRIDRLTMSSQKCHFLHQTGAKKSRYWAKPLMCIILLIERISRLVIPLILQKIVLPLSCGNSIKSTESKEFTLPRLIRSIWMTLHLMPCAYRNK